MFSDTEVPCQDLKLAMKSFSATVMLVASREGRIQANGTHCLKSCSRCPQTKIQKHTLKAEPY